MLCGNITLFGVVEYYLCTGLMRSSATPTSVILPHSTPDSGSFVIFPHIFRVPIFLNPKNPSHSEGFCAGNFGTKRQTPKAF